MASEPSRTSLAANLEMLEGLLDTLPGQKIGEEPARTDLVFHGPATMTADGKKAYLGYGDLPQTQPV